MCVPSPPVLDVAAAAVANHAERLVHAGGQSAGGSRSVARVVEIGHLAALTERIALRLRPLADAGLVDYVVCESDREWDGLSAAGLPGWVKQAPLGAADVGAVGSAGEAGIHGLRPRAADLVVLGAATWRQPDADRVLALAKSLLAPGGVVVHVEPVRPPPPPKTFRRAVAPP
eukprot:872642-Prorocentrum_minimum.AAC.1